MLDRPSTPAADDAPPPFVRPVWIVGFFGHRRLARPERVGAAIQRELAELQRAVAARGGELHLHASAAAGADLLALAAARELQMPVHLLLPLPEEEFARDFSTGVSWAEAHAAIEACEHAGLVASRRVAQTAIMRPSCYFDADARIVEGSDVLLTVWDGREAEGVGGTGQMAALARALGRPLVRIDPENLAVDRDGIEPGWPQADAKWAWLLKTRIVAAPLATGSGENSPQRVCEQMKERIASIANRGGDHFRERVARVLRLGLIAGFVGTIGGLLGTGVPSWVPTTLIGLQLVMVIAVVWLKRDFKRRGVHEEWLEARLAAEILRGLEASQPVADVLHPIVARLKPEWRRFAVTVAMLMARRGAESMATPAGLDAFKRRYAETRLADQRTYFVAKHAESRRAMRRIEKIGSTCTTAAPFFVMLALVNKLVGGGWQNLPWGIVPVGLFPILLPLIGATIGSFSSNMDHERRRKRYPGMARSLEALERELPHLWTETSVAAFVGRAEELLLGEQIEWDFAARRAKPG